MPQVHPVRFPDSFYLPRYSRCGIEIRDLMPWEGALSYVTDGFRFGAQLRDGSIEWILEPEEIDRASHYRIAYDKLPEGLRVEATARDVIHEIWRENGSIFATLWARDANPHAA